MRKVIKAYEIVYPNAIRVLKGATLSILREESNPSWKGWLWCRSEDGQEGWISKDYMDIQGDVGQGAVGKMNRDYDAKEVAVHPGETVQVLKEEKGWSWVRKNDGSEGWVPSGNLAGED